MITLTTISIATLIVGLTVLIISGIVFYQLSSKVRLEEDEYRKFTKELDGLREDLRKRKCKC